MDFKRTRLIKALREFAFSGNGIIVGPPGVGKSFALRNFCNQLIKEKIPCLYLPIDKLGVETEHALKAELNIKTDFITFLRNEVREKSIGIVVIDAFDAARSEIAQKFFLSLTRKIISNLRGEWNVILSVRTYDAQKSEELQELFPVLTLPPEEFQIPAIHCRHFAIPKLSEKEILEAAKTIPHLRALYTTGSVDFKELLRIPFNLWLIEKLLSSGVDFSELSNVSSEVQLLARFWKQRVTDGRLGDEKGVILTRVTKSLVEQHSLSVRTEEVYLPGSSSAWTELLSLEVLTNTSITAQRVAFSHNILFDYAVSVLLIEDDPNELAKFVSQEPSRPLFLRPSLNFYFTRLWHSSPEIFWQAFWRMLPSADLHLRLLFRILPPTVIVNETRELGQLDPLLAALRKGRSDANIAVLRLLQALRALQIQRDILWVQFLDRIANYINEQFAWDLTVITLDILKRNESSNDKIITGICGGIGRRLLEWVWDRRRAEGHSWTDRLGASHVVPLVVRTFSTNPVESRKLLAGILDLVKEREFPIDFIYRLTNELEHVWPYDAEFTCQIYETVFGYHESSQEKTHMGGIVLPLSSTRQQDYHMCEYQLVEHFPKFLRAAPTTATSMALHILNQYIIGRHIVPYLKKGASVEQLVEEFPFRKRKAKYLPDLSYIWDETQYRDEPLKMAEAIYELLSEKASSKSTFKQLDELLDVFRDAVLTAFFWRRLLLLASKNPKAFKNRLFELCIARPVQRHDETLRELGLFLEAAASEFSAAQMRRIEKTITALPMTESRPEHREYLERRRDRLLGRLPLERFQTSKGKAIRQEITKSNKIVANEPLVKFTTSWGPFSEDESLVEEGTNLESPNNQRLRTLYEPVGKFATEWVNKIPPLEAIKRILPNARDVYITLNQPNEADAPIVNAAWAKIAACVETMSRGIANPETEEFRFVREVLLRCAKHPLPEPDAENDANYNSPFWSSAPRTEAAQGLSWLAVRKPDADILNAIESLIHDRKPSVRYLSTRELFRTFNNSPEWFWTAAEGIAEVETNKVVQQALCHSLTYVAARAPEKTANVLSKLIVQSSSFENDHDVIESVVSLVMWLHLDRNDPWALTVAESFLKEPVRLAKHLRRAVFDTLSFITAENAASKSPIFTRSIDWIIQAVKAAARGIRELRQVPFAEWDEARRSKLHEVYRVIDEIITRLYFSTRDRKENAEPVPDEKRRPFYWTTKPILEEVLSFSRDAENGILFAPTAHHFMKLLNRTLKYDPTGTLHMAAEVAQSSKATNYNLDALAIREVVKLVEAILADYRSEVREAQSLEDLLNLLDVFAETGWPDALRLVWRLDEVFR